MGQTKPLHQSVYGQFLLGKDRPQQPLPPGLTLNSGYTRTPTPQGQVIGNRSDQKFYRYPGPRLPYYGANQVFTATRWDNGDGSGFRPMPVVRTDPFDGHVLIAVMEYDQDIALIPFSHGVLHIAGVSYDDAPEVWSITLIGANGANNTIVPDHHGFNITQNVDTQTLLNVNLGLYPSLPGAIEGLKHPVSRVDYIAFAFYS